MKKKMKSKKGFTLVEIVVVLVILAILAAIAIPAYTGYIDKANERAIAAEARSVLMAAQTLGSEAYGLNAVTTSQITIAKIAELSEADGTIKVSFNSKGLVTALSYASGTKVASYNGATWSIPGAELAEALTIATP